MFKDKHLLVIGTGSPKRHHVMSVLSRLGLGRITCLNAAPNWAEPFVDGWILADPVHPSEETTGRICATIGKPDGIVTFDDYSVVLTAHLASELGLVGISPETALRAKNKADFRNLCQVHGIPAPRFIRIAPEEPDIGARLTAAGLECPVVLKPALGAGSILVRRADNLSEVSRIFSEFRREIATHPASADWPVHDFLVEEYLEGPEVDIDMLVQDGELKYAAVSDNFAPREPYFLEMGGQIPSGLPNLAQEELTRVAFAAVTALGVRDGCIHFEARWTARGAVPIEANLRLGGAEVYAFNRGAYGVDLVEGAVRIALGVPLASQRSDEPLRYLRSANFISPVSGPLGDIRIDPSLRSDHSVMELVTSCRIGHAVRVPPEGYESLGWLVAAGDTRSQANQNLHQVVEKIEFQVNGRAFHGAYTGN